MFTSITLAFVLGTASFYGKECHGKRMANGQYFDMHKLTCASWDYPFDTKLRVTNMANGQSVEVTVTDRGPNKRLNRIIDLSQAAFDYIADLKVGLIKVKVEKL